MSAETLSTCSSRQPDAKMQCTARRLPPPQSLFTTVSLLLQFKDPTHRARGAWVQVSLLPVYHSVHANFSLQEQAGMYSVRHSTASDPHHVLLLYKSSKYSAQLQGVISNGQGPTESVFWRWGWLPVWFEYNVWVFKEGTVELESDGGYVCVYFAISGCG